MPFVALEQAVKPVTHGQFSLSDTRTMEYFDRTSLRFLEHFTSDLDAERRFSEHIKEVYLQGGRAVGNNPKGIAMFLDAFRNDFESSPDEARALIYTTVSRARTFGQVSGLRASAAKTFVIAGPRDSLTCQICAIMIGQVFSVEMAAKWQDALVAAGSTSVDLASPLLEVRMSIDEVRKATPRQLQAAGVALPPFHRSCRHRTVVDDFYGEDEDVPYSVLR